MKNELVYSLGLRFFACSGGANSFALVQSWDQGGIEQQTAWTPSLSCPWTSEILFVFFRTRVNMESAFSSVLYCTSSDNQSLNDTMTILVRYGQMVMLGQQ
jgi:hypothetical protein